MDHRLHTRSAVVCTLRPVFCLRDVPLFLVEVRVLALRSIRSRFPLVLLSLGVVAFHPACDSESDESNAPPASGGSGQEAGAQGGAAGTAGAAGAQPQSGGSAGQAAGAAGAAGMDAGEGGATLDASDETSEASAKACSVDPLPAIGEYTPDYEPLTACTCAPGDNPACHGLFQARVVEVSADGVLTVNTGAIIQGPSIGTNTTGQEAQGPHCV